MSPWNSAFPNWTAAPLRRALGAAFGLAALLVLAFGGVAFRRYSTNVATTRIQAGLEELSANTAEAVRRDLGERRREIEFASLAREFRVPAVGRDDMRLFLRRLQEISPNYAFIGFIDANGRFLATSNHLAENVDVSSRDYWRVGKNDIFIGDAHEAIVLAASLGSEDATPRFIDISAPVREGDRLFGVLAAHLAADWARDIAARARLNAQPPLDRARVDILDGSGAALYSTPRHGEQQKFLPDEQFTAESSIKEIGENGQLHWTVRVALPKSIALAEIEAVRRVVRFGGAAFVLVSALIGWLFGLFLGRRLERLTDGVMWMPDGKFPDPGVSGLQEIDDLGTALRLRCAMGPRPPVVPTAERGLLALGKIGGERHVAMGYDFPRKASSLARIVS